MNPIDTALKVYIDNMFRDFQYINQTSRDATLVNLESYAAGMIRVCRFARGRADASLNIDALQLENSSSVQSQYTIEREIIHAQKPEITALNDICGYERCNNSIAGMRKGTKFCSKKCNNLSRK